DVRTTARGAAASDGRRANAYIACVIAAAAATIAVMTWFVIARVPLTFEGGLAIAAPTFVAGYVLLNRYGITLHWQGQLVTATFDEVAVFLGFVFLPPALVVLLVACGALVSQMWSRRDALKTAYNVAEFTLAAVPAAALVAFLESRGAPAILAAVPAPFVFAVGSNVLLALLFSLLDGSSAERTFVDRLAPTGLISASLALAVGLSVIGLWLIHPLALVAFAPFVIVGQRHSSLVERADRELTVHRHLARSMHDLVGLPHLDAVGRKVVEACGALFPCGRATLFLEEKEAGRYREWSRDFGAGPDESRRMTERLPARDGGSLGEIAVFAAARRSAPFTESDRELLRIVAGQAAAAIENARALSELDRARRDLESYLTTAGDPVLLIDAVGRLRYANPAARTLFALGTGDVARVEAVSLMPEPRLEAAEIGRVTEHFLVELVGMSADRARTFPVEMHAAPVRVDDQETGLIVIARDVTERRAQHDALVRQEKLSALGTLVAGVAHEVNNPLTYIKGALDFAVEDVSALAQDPGVPTPRREVAANTARQLANALEGVDRLRNIARALRNVARPGTGERQEEDIGIIAHDVVDVVRMGAPGGVRFVFDATPDLPRAFVNAGEIHQVLLNLVKNAAEAVAADGGEVRVSARREGDTVRIDVADDGPGIPPEIRERLFTPFFTTKEKGTGLGLSISLGIIEAHGGSLTLSAPPSGGTRMSIALPDARAARSLPAPDASELPPVPGPALARASRSSHSQTDMNTRRKEKE
ncbi:MAG: two-component system sensor histidine kinase NtrB, partial [Thermoplasmatota archaeon]